MGKSTISMAMFNNFLYVYQRVTSEHVDLQILSKGSGAPFLRGSHHSQARPLGPGIQGIRLQISLRCIEYTILIRTLRYFKRVFVDDDDEFGYIAC